MFAATFRVLLPRDDSKSSRDHVHVPCEYSKSSRDYVDVPVIIRKVAAIILPCNTVTVIGQ